MQLNDVLQYLKDHADEKTKKIYLNHGAKEPLFGVKMADLKNLKKKIKQDHILASELFNTNIFDAMHLAGLIEDISLVTKTQLDEWVKKAYCTELAERSIAVLAAKSPFGFEMAKKWVHSNEDMIICAGYATYMTLFMTKDDELIDFNEVKNLLEIIKTTIHNQSLVVQNSMNNTLIIAGIYIEPLHDFALRIADQIGRIDPVLAKNSCNSQTASEYLRKYSEQNRLGKKIKNLNR